MELRTAAVTEAAISLDSVTRAQGPFTLGPLDMHVPTGLVTGFVGPNGAGKTTTIKAILGMVGTDAGTIRVLGDAPGTHHQRIGVVLDSVPLAREWTAVTAARALRGFYPCWDDPTYTDLLRRLAVPEDVRVRSLSRGEGVKLQLALALAHQPDLLVLDEPTSGLDPVARLDVLDVLREFLVEEGRSILLSTHITADLERIADHLHVLVAGHTRFAGPLSELTEVWALVRGPARSLTSEAEAALVGTRLTSGGTFEGLVATSDTALFGPEVVMEAPALDEAVAALTRGAGRPSGRRPTTSPALATGR